MKMTIELEFMGDDYFICWDWCNENVVGQFDVKTIKGKWGEPTRWLTLYDEDDYIMCVLRFG